LTVLIHLAERLANFRELLVEQQENGTFNRVRQDKIRFHGKSKLKSTRACCRLMPSRPAAVQIKILGPSGALNRFSATRREAERPNSIWQADHTPLDILLV
jgi:hypothetical protein